MEQLFYKVRLQSGRVIGPIDLARIKLLILKDRITGLEMARLYPTGDWKDINTFPEVANLLMSKLEGKLEPDVEAPALLQEENETKEALIPISGTKVSPAPPPPPDGQTQTGTAPLHDTAGSLAVDTHSHADNSQNKEVDLAASPPLAVDEERTVMVTADNESTMMVEKPVPAMAVVETESRSVELSSIEDEAVPEEYRPADPAIAQEKTMMLSMDRPPRDGEVAPGKSGVSGRKKLVGSLLLIFGAIYLYYSGLDQTPVVAEEAPFRVLLPNTEPKPDPVKSENIFKSGLKLYYEDTVDGYKKSANIFLKAAAWDSNNVRALCLLASCYMNLIDVVNRNEAYFNTVTKLIEIERAKGVDLAETVIADVELYNVLGNPDAAFNRIVDFAKTHEWGVDMLYYLALTFYLKNNYDEALAQLNKIDPKDWFSPKIAYLYGQIYEKVGNVDEALKAYHYVVDHSKKHIKAHVRLADLEFGKDNLPEALKQADAVIFFKNLASRQELSKAYYFRGRIRMAGNHDVEALKDFEIARENASEDQDLLLDYYTLRARMGEKVSGANGTAQMFDFMAQGERALKEDHVDEALSQFLSAREADEKDPTPLLRLADVFIRKADLQSANANFAKALALAPKLKDIYPKYIHTLIQAYELEDAAQVIGRFKEQQGEPTKIDRLQGELFYKQEKYQEANISLKKAMEASNFDSSVYNAYANLMFKTQNFRDSAFYYGLALRFDPYNVEAVIGVGKSLAELESLEKGVTYVQAALEASPAKAALLNGIAEIYVRKGDYAKGLQFADNALTTDPKYALAYKTKGEAYADQDKHDEALDAYLSYTNFAPLDPDGHIERHKLFLKPDKKGRLDLAAAKLELLTVAKAYPRYPGIHYLLGDLFYKSGDIDKALFESQVEIKNNPNQLAAYVLAGTILNDSKDYKGALEVGNKLMKMAPTYAQGLIVAGVANHGLKTYAAAQSMLERAQALDAGNPVVYQKLGRLYYDMQFYDKMKVAFKKYLEVYPDAPDKSEVESYLAKLR